MSQSSSDQPLSNPRSTNELAEERTELAKFRSRAAAERTLMAWMRTSLSLLGFGFGIPTIVSTIERTRIGQHINPVRFSVIVGLAFIATGIFGMSAALREHRRTLKLIQSDRYTYESSSSAEIVGVALLVIGLVSFLGVLLRAI